MNAQQFLETIFGQLNKDLWLYLWRRDEKVTFWHNSIASAAAEAEKIAPWGDMYYGVGLSGKRKSRKERAAADDVAAIPGLWLDVDVANDGAHAQENLPPDRDAAIDLVNSAPLKPSLLVWSGYGLHAYWLFAELWRFGDGENAKAADLSEKWQRLLRIAAQARGWKLDSTHDLSRVLRPAGTFNHKAGGKAAVEVIYSSDDRYSIDAFLPHLENLPEIVETKRQRKSAHAPVQSGDMGSAHIMLDSCKFIQHCRSEATRLPEPEWYAMVSNVARAGGGPEMVHELSRPYQKYDPREVDDKIRHALGEGHPHTCDYIRGTLGFIGCPDGGCGFAAPCGWSLNKLSVAREKVREIASMDVAQVFDAEVIGALALVKREVPAEYAKIKAALKGKVNLNDFDRAVGHKVAEMNNLRLVQSNDAPAALTDILPDVPLKELRLPPNWTFNEHGVRQTICKKQTSETVIASPVPVILTKRYRNIESGEEKVELAYYRDKAWHYILSRRASVFSSSSLIELGNRGLPVSSESARHLVRWLDDLERENLLTLPVVRSVGHMGWVTEKQFLPGVCENVELDFDDNGGAVTVAGGYRENGDLADWISSMAEVRNHPIARFMMAASFASPLLRLTAQRVFFVHAWGRSGGGKTAALMAALSVWGCPEDIITSFDGTKVGLERLASFYSDLPMGIDERQTADNRFGGIDRLIYMLGMGKSKVRGAKNGGLQAGANWRSICITSGEEPLTEQASTGGLKRRALEIYGRPIDDDAFASSLYDKAAKNHGTAGPAFIRRLLEEQSNGLDVRGYYDQIKADLVETYPDNMETHLGYVALIAMADFYASQWIWGLDAGTAGDEAFAMAADIVRRLETKTEAADVSRATDFVVQWVAANAEHFRDNSPQQWGFRDGMDLCIIPYILRDALKEAGYPAERALQDLAESGVIMTESDGDGKSRRTIRKYFNGTRCRMTVLNMSALGGEGEW